MTDNFGRTEQLTTDSMRVQAGTLHRKPVEAPVVLVG